MILHCDMDAFYASVEQRDNPRLVGHPVIVGGTAENRGVVAAANYKAREFGVHSAMPTATARRLCPHAILLPCRMEYYGRISRQIRAIFERYTPQIEPLSLDEAFLDVGGSVGLFGSAVEIAVQMKAEIRAELSLVASVGVAPNKFLAKIASDLEKPDGLVVVEPDHIQQFLDPLPVGRLWGVGRATGQVLDRLGIRTIAQLRALAPDTLRDCFGASGEHFWQLAHGIDDRRVVPDREAKSISHETTFPTDIADLDVLRACLLELAEQVARRLRRHELRARTVEIKVRFADFRTITRSHSLAQPSHITQELWRAGDELLRTRLPPGHLPLRLLGFGTSGLVGPGQVQQQLFDQDEQRRQQQLDAATDEIRERFGISALNSGAALRRDASSSKRRQ